jgi:hypothetical protein
VEVTEQNLWEKEDLKDPYITPIKQCQLTPTSFAWYRSLDEGDQRLQGIDTKVLKLPYTVIQKACKRGNCMYTRKQDIHKIWIKVDRKTAITLLQYKKNQISHTSEAIFIPPHHHNIR